VNILFWFLGWFVGIFIGSFLLVQPLIILFFSIPTTIRFKKSGAMASTTPIIKRDVFAFLVQVGLFLVSVWVVSSFLPKWTIGFWFGVSIVLIMSLGKISRPYRNMPEYIENYAKWLSKDFLFRYIESVKENQPETSAREQHINKIITQKNESFELSKGQNDILAEIDTPTAVSYIMQANMDDLSEQWAKMKEDLEYVHPQIFNEVSEEWVQYEILLTSVALDLVAVYNLYPMNQAKILHEGMLTMLANVEEVGNYSVEAVKDIYHPAAIKALADNQAPFDMMVSILALRIGIEDPDPLTMTALSVSVSKLVGKWKWIQENFHIQAA
jgi:hypothetical protein